MISISRWRERERKRWPKPLQFIRWKTGKLRKGCIFENIHKSRKRKLDQVAVQNLEVVQQDEGVIAGEWQPEDLPFLSLRVGTSAIMKQ